MTGLRRWLVRSGIGLALLAIVVVLAFLARHELTRRVAGLPSFTHGAGERFDRMVAMGDGVKLFTKVELPEGVGPFPTVLVRSPYAQVDWLLRDHLCGRFIRYGYGCVYQDTRGQGGSEGSWDPGSDEITDGRDTLAWLASQDFQDGNLAMVGSSYLASVQFSALAGGAPPELKTIVPAMYTTDNREVMFQDGLFRHETYTAWASVMRGPDHGTDDAGAEYQAAIRHRPHNEVDTEIFGVAMPWYQEMIAATSPADDFWQRESRVRVRRVPQTLGIPVLMVGGWYDVFFGPQFEDWQRLATQADSRYIIGPWTHSGGVGDLEMPNADGGQFQWAEMLPWLAHHLKGEPLAERLFLSGAIRVTLDVASSAPDSAFTAKLIEVFADGRTFNIRDSATTLAWRNGADTPQSYTPDERVSVSLDFWPIAWRTQPGSRLRLDVSSSDFPKFHAHTNRAGAWAAQTGADLARQVVYGGKLELPVER